MLFDSVIIFQICEVERWDPSLCGRLLENIFDFFVNIATISETSKLKQNSSLPAPIRLLTCLNGLSW